jgi:hypothetical protein
MATITSRGPRDRDSQGSVRILPVNRFLAIQYRFGFSFFGYEWDFQGQEAHVAVIVINGQFNETFFPAYGSLITNYSIISRRS